MRVNLDGAVYECEAVSITQQDLFTAVGVLDGMWTEVELRNVRTIDGQKVPVTNGDYVTAKRTRELTILTESGESREDV